MYVSTCGMVFAWKEYRLTSLGSLISGAAPLAPPPAVAMVVVLVRGVEVRGEG